MRESVKNIFNDVYLFFFKKKGKLEDLFLKYPDNRLLKSLLSHLITEEKIDHMPCMNAMYAFFKKYSVEEITDDSYWEKVIAETSAIYATYKCEWCKQVLLNLMDIIEQIQKPSMKAA